MGDIGDGRDALGLPLVADSFTPAPVKEDELDWALNIDRQIHWYGFGMTAFMGFSLNCLAFWVWGFKPTYSPLVFMFKALAVADNMFIFFFNVWWFVRRGTRAEFVLQGLTFWAQYMSVHITLALTVCRCMASFWPISARRLLSRQRMVLALVVIVGYCGALKLTERLLNRSLQDVWQRSMVNVALASLLLLLPFSLQALLTPLLACKLLRPRLTVGPAPADRKQTGRQSGDAASRSQDSRVSWTGYKRRQIYIVIAINVMTFITYPVGTALNVYLLLHPHVLHLGWRMVVVTVIMQMQIVNSALNFFIYAYFNFGFRRLLLMKCTAPDHYYNYNVLWAAIGNSRSHLEMGSGGEGELAKAGGAAASTDTPARPLPRSPDRSRHLLTRASDQVLLEKKSNSLVAPPLPHLPANKDLWRVQAAHNPPFLPHLTTGSESSTD